MKVNEEAEPFAPESQPPTAVEATRKLPVDLRGTSEDINRLRAAGFDIDDDNDPAPENIPDNSTTGDDFWGNGKRMAFAGE